MSPSPPSRPANDPNTHPHRSGSRSRHARATTATSAHGPTSPVAGSSSGDAGDDANRPAKRARKPINCEPCRASKLKCDRNRPCSSCVLRGTSAACYAGSDAASPSAGPIVRGVDVSNVDPTQEMAKIRHSLSVLENYMQRGSQLPAPTASPSRKRSLAASHGESMSMVVETTHRDVSPKKSDALEPDMVNKRSVPGMLGQSGQGGLYAGPTSAVMHLASNDAREESQQSSEDGTACLAEESQHDYDMDLHESLPSTDVMDELIQFYFAYCNWIYRHVDPHTFPGAWRRYKEGSSPNRLVLATVCVMMSIAVFYLPRGHQLLHKLPPETPEELGKRWYNGVMKRAFSRYQAEGRVYSIELVELLLIRTHFLYLTKSNSEEIWTLKGELVTIGTAMGLHMDPRKFRMGKDVAERRRWAWWHIILLERWQAFMFGRPISIASHHFDTMLPSAINPRQPSLYLANIAIFKLAYILGFIMDDALSIRPTRYESVLDNDERLQGWYDDLPKELKMDDLNTARSLASQDVAIRRLGVQSVIIVTSYLHIRFTLHRPYVVAPPGGHDKSESRKGRSKSGSASSPTTTPTQASLDTAVNSARQLIHIVNQVRPDFRANVSLAVPGHMNWGPFHAFSAAMFFSFQLIASPDQAGANMFRQNVRTALQVLEQASMDTPIAAKCLAVLKALVPLSLADGRETGEERGEVMARVKKLAFPYHDSPSYPYAYGEGELPAVVGNESPKSLSGVSGRTRTMSHSSASVSPPIPASRSAYRQVVGPAEPMNTMGHLGQHRYSGQTIVVEDRNGSGSGMGGAYRSMPELSALAPFTHPPPMPPSHMYEDGSGGGGGGGGMQVQYSPQQQAQQQPSASYPQYYDAEGQYQMYQGQQQYVPMGNEEMGVWGASTGIAIGEWDAFMRGGGSAPAVPMHQG